MNNVKDIPLSWKVRVMVHVANGAIRTGNYISYVGSRFYKLAKIILHKIPPQVLENEKQEEAPNPFIDPPIYCTAGCGTPKKKIDAWYKGMCRECAKELLSG